MVCSFLLAPRLVLFHVKQVNEMFSVIAGLLCAGAGLLFHVEHARHQFYGETLLARTFSKSTAVPRGTVTRGGLAASFGK